MLSDVHKSPGKRGGEILRRPLAQAPQNSAQKQRARETPKVRELVSTTSFLIETLTIRNGPKLENTTRPMSNRNSLPASCVAFEARATAVADLASHLLLDTRHCIPRSHSGHGRRVSNRQLEEFETALRVKKQRTAPHPDRPISLGINGAGGSSPIDRLSRGKEDS
jgi:hypothetical protein